MAVRGRKHEYVTFYAQHWLTKKPHGLTNTSNKHQKKEIYYIFRIRSNCAVSNAIILKRDFKDSVECVLCLSKNHWITSTYSERLWSLHYRKVILSKVVSAFSRDSVTSISRKCYGNRHVRIYSKTNIGITKK